MDGMVEENGTSGGGGGGGGQDPLGSAGSSGAGHVVAVTRIVQLTLPAQAPSAQVLTYLLVTLAMFNLYTITSTKIK